MEHPMKQLLLSLLTAALLSGCGDPNYTLSGKIEAAPGDSLRLVALDRQRTEIAAGTVAADSTFVLQGFVATPTAAQLVTLRHQPLALVFVEPGNIRLVRSGTAFEAAGTPSNDRYNELNRKLGTVRDAFARLGAQSMAQADSLQHLFRRTVLEAIEANRNNIFGVYAFLNHEFDPSHPEEAAEQIARFAPELQQSDLLRQAQRQIAAVANTRIGMPCTELTLPDTSGNPVVLSELIGPGKWVLIDFWATWCGPCKRDLPHLREAYKVYRDRGLEIYAVSLDNDREAWKKFVAENDMPWLNVCAIDDDGSSPAAESYAIQSIPSNFLVSPEGVIIARNLRGESMADSLTLMAQLGKFIN